MRLFVSTRAVILASIREPVDVPAQAIFPECVAPHVAGMVEIEDVGAYLQAQRAEALRVIRWGAVGDVLMATVGADMLRRAYGLPVIIDADPKKYAGLEAEGVTFGAAHLRKRGPHRVVSLMLRLVFETDHYAKTDPFYWGIGRVRKTAYTGGVFFDAEDRSWKRFVGKEAVPVDAAPRWEIIRPTTASRERAHELLAARGMTKDRRSRPLLAVNGASANSRFRTPAPALVEAAVRAMVAAGYDVVMADGRIYPWARDPALAPHVLEVPKTNVGEAVALHEQADAAVTPDSGSLWFAHAARVPVVYWEGVSDHERIMEDFPLGPAGYRVVRQAAKVGCRPCGEYAAECGWRAACQTDPPADWFAAETVDGVKALVGAPV
jgi:hypothetical protein